MRTTRLARRRLGALPLLIFLGFMVNDASFIFSSRHDWEPTALALLLRLLLVGTWLHGEAMPATSSRNSIVLGLLTGLSILEKVNNVVLLPALAWMVLRRTPRPRQLAVAAAGVAVGRLLREPLRSPACPVRAG